MKRAIVLGISFIFLVLLINGVSAICNLDAKLLNQDPYPANPGNYVKIVIQVNGTENTDCGRLVFNLAPEYPFSLDSPSDAMVIVDGGNYVSGYSSMILVPYNVRVDENAVDGDNKIRFEYGRGDNTLSNWANDAKLIKDFNINIKDTRTDFELSIQSYSKTSDSVTFGLVNIGKNDAESVVLEVLKQDNFDVKGSTNVIIGKLSTNDDTTATIKGTPKEGDITVRISYNDKNSFRRTIEKTVKFTDGNLNGSASTPAYRGSYYYLFWLIFIGLIIYIYYRYRKSKNAKNNKNLALLKK